MLRFKRPLILYLAQHGVGLMWTIWLDASAMWCPVGRSIATSEDPDFVLRTQIQLIR